MTARPPTAVRFHRTPLTFPSTDGYAVLKDPCPVQDGTRWHLFGTGVRAADGGREILHAVAADYAGPWRLLQPAALLGVEGGCLAAPGVIAEDGALRMFLQTEYDRVGGRVESLSSSDGGATFTFRSTALRSLPGTPEAGIYDPHPARIGAERYLVYSAFSVVGQPDIYLARSTSDSWDGPYERLGCIVEHPHVSYHNQREDTGYEWGLEGAQLVELPDGRVLLNAVCFLAGAPAGSRQRIFLAVAEDVRGPYHILGPALEPPGGPGAGENGHGAALVHGGTLLLFFQERQLDGPWQYALASAPVPGATAS